MPLWFDKSVDITSCKVRETYQRINSCLRMKDRSLQYGSIFKSSLKFVMHAALKTNYPQKTLICGQICGQIYPTGGSKSFVYIYSTRPIF